MPSGFLGLMIAFVFVISAIGLSHAEGPAVGSFRVSTLSSKLNEETSFASRALILLNST
jgi:hypothetical protein